MNKKLVRPRKKEGVISFGGLQRAGIVMNAYDETRENDEKHIVGVAQSVEVTR